MSNASRSRNGDDPDALSPTAPSSAIGSPSPSYDWTPKPSSSARFPPRRGSTASSISSIGGSLDVGQPQSTRLGTVRDVGQNAISTLLQPPIVRTGLLPHTSAPLSAAHKPPSNRDIPPVTLTNIPHVEPSAFQSYLAQVGPLFDANLRAEGEEPSSQWLRRDRGGTDEFADGLDRSASREPQRPRPGSRQASIVSVASLEAAPPRRKSSGAFPKRQLTVTPLSTIPSVYFEDNFHLENPRTFDIVSERSEVVRNPKSPTEENAMNASANGAAVQPRKALATNAILQEKLSWYLDTVEIHLISSISAASKSFFTALGSLKDLHSEAAESVAKIKRLREDLAKLDKDMALGGLEIVSMRQRRENLRRLGDATLQLRCVVEGAEHCQQLVDEGELEIAVDRISILEEFTCGAVDSNVDLSWLCHDRPRRLYDLRRIRCLDGFADAMEQLRMRVGKGYETRFLDALLTDLREHVKKVPHQESLRRWAQASQRSRGRHAPGPSIVPTYLQTNSQLRKDLSSILSGLSRSNYTSAASKAFWDAIMKEMKKLIQQQLPSSSDDDAESTVSASTRSSRTPSRTEKSAILARNLRALNPEDAEELFTKIYCAVSEALRRLQVQIKLLLDVTSGQAATSPGSAGTISPYRSPKLGGIEATIDSVVGDNNLQDQLMQALDMSSLLGQAVDIAHTQINKILRVRSEETAQLGLRHFLRYFTLNRLFADECEAVSGRSGASLRGVVDVQIKEWIGLLAEREMQELADTMEKDRWDAQDFTDADSLVLQQLLQAMGADPEPWLAQAYVWEPYAKVPQESNGISDRALNLSTDANGTKEKARPAVIDEDKYLLVKSAVHLLHGLSRFATLLACLPRLAPEISSSILDYLRLFTSRTNQLVLFAGATRSAGLERINTKHLALASQALGFVVALTPYLREFIRRKTSSGSSGAGTAGASPNPGTPGAAVMTGFDSVMRSTQNGQISIHEKLVSIMTMRAQAHVKEMRKIDFDSEGAADADRAAAADGDAKGGEPDGRVSRHMETLTKETATLHRVLARHLPELTVGMIMRPVFDSYREVWGDAFREAVVRTEAGRRRLLRDAQLFDARLSRIDPAAADVAAHLASIVMDKQLAGAGNRTTTPQPQQQQQQQPSQQQPGPDMAAEGSGPKVTIDEGGGGQGAEKG